MNNIDDLLKEFGDSYYTREEFEADRARLLTRLCAKHGITESEVDTLIREHNYTHSAEDPEDEYIGIMTMADAAGWVGGDPSNAVPAKTSVHVGALNVERLVEALESSSLEHERIAADPIGYLSDCLRDAGIVPTWDRRRNITHPCWRCDTTSEPRDLVEIGRYTRFVGGNLKPGDAIMRPLCAACVAATAPPPEAAP